MFLLPFKAALINENVFINATDISLSAYIFSDMRQYYICFEVQ